MMELGGRVMFENEWEGVTIAEAESGGEVIIDAMDGMDAKWICVAGRWVSQPIDWNRNRNWNRNWI